LIQINQLIHSKKPQYRGFLIEQITKNYQDFPAVSLPEALIDVKADDGIAAVHNPERVQEVKRLESPDNF
jgi:CPA1 family monovalent cation:H+ antiporter